jgi:hypothetical protein
VRGGFDAVIGNPPYIRIQTMKEWAPLEVEFYKSAFAAAGKGNYDIYTVFVEKGIGLLNAKGRLGFILPHKFFNAQYGEPLRALLAKGKHLSGVVHFGDQQVFAGATTYTCLLFLDKGGAASCKFKKVADMESWRQTGEGTEGEFPASEIAATEWNFTVGHGADLFERLRRMPVKLGDVAERIFQGLVTSSDSIYLLDPIEVEGINIRVKSRATNREYVIEAEVAHPLCKGSRDIRRYLAMPSKIVLFPYDAVSSAKMGKSILIPSKDFSDHYPLAWKYLEENKTALRDREKGKMCHDGWYGYVYPKSVSLFARAKILTPSIASGPAYTLDNNGDLYFVGSGGGGGGGYGIILNNDFNISYEYVLGLLNSRLLNLYLKKISTTYRGGYYAYNRQYIEQLPIRPIDFTDPSDRERHDRMVTLVEQMLLLHKRLAAAKTDHEKTNLQRQIDATDGQIDRLVYELYELTEEEIKLVERV